MRETILEIGRDLAVGQSVMAECPECGVKKLSVTRYSDGLGYLCWRASCILKPGSVSDSGGYDAPAALRTHIPFKPQPFQYEHKVHGYAEIFIGSDHSAFNVHNTSDYSAVFYFLDFEYRLRGWQSRTAEKALRSGKLLPGPLYGVYGGTAIAETGSLWLVEDPKSAIVLARRGRPALTILGTRLDVAVLDELWDAYPDCRRIYVALDPGAEDAAREAVRLCRSERGLDAIQVPLPDDIHRLDQDTLTRLLEAYP